MPILLPDILEPERTPLVEQLLDINALQQDRIQQLQDEIARLKGLKTRPRIALSTLEAPTRPPCDPNAKRPGSAKRSKTAQLTITEDIVVRLVDHPDEAVFKGYGDFVVQDLILKPRVIRYRRERWLTPDGTSLVAPLPADVLPGSHYGPDLIGYIVHQYHHQHVTQPLLLEQLHQVYRPGCGRNLNVDFSAWFWCLGSINYLLQESSHRRPDRQFFSREYHPADHRGGHRGISAGRVAVDWGRLRRCVRTRGGRDRDSHTRQ